METGYTKSLVDKIKYEIRKAVINQDDMTELALTALLSGGHILLQGVPGLAKTLWVRTLAETLSVEFKRTQFTPDLMPSEITGTKVFNLQAGSFDLKRGPLFTNLFLADEINRTPPKTQSALLEIMEEKGVTIDGETHVMQEPFFVIATQNPLEFEGTYPLPEALTDRFMMKLIIDYPGIAAEKEILQMYDKGFESKKLDPAGISAVCGSREFLACKEEIKKVTVDDGIINYILSIVETTRRMNVVSVGASPRASIALLLNAKAYAAIRGRDFVIPEDVKDLAIPILRHRIHLKPEAEIDGVKTESVIDTILSQLKVPR